VESCISHDYSGEVNHLKNPSTTSWLSYLFILSTDYTDARKTCLTPRYNKLCALNDVIAALLLWMNCVLRMTSLYRYEWRYKFKCYYKKKCIMRISIFIISVLKKKWYKLCRKTNQTPTVGTYGMSNSRVNV
jgi:hypothetical protein